MGVARRAGVSPSSAPEPTTHRRGASAAEDAALLERWRGGDRHAGSCLVRRHHASIAGFFANAAGDGERQDLTQQTFERITRGKDYFRGDCSVRTYFFRVAHGVLVDHLRRRYRKDFDPLTHSVVDVDGATPSRVIAELGRAHQLLVCLRALPVETKQMLELYYWQGCTAAELGAIFSVPEGTIRRRVFDAKAALRAGMLAGGESPEGDDVALEQQLRELAVLLAVGPVAV